jgi:hypothetical protein
MSQACPGGRPRELVEPVSIWTVTGGMAGRFRGLERDSAPAGLLWLRTRQGRAAPGGGGQALSRSRGQQAWDGVGGGRQIDRRPAWMRQPNSGSGRPRAGGRQTAVRRWGQASRAT